MSGRYFTRQRYQVLCGFLLLLIGMGGPRAEPFALGNVEAPTMVAAVNKAGSQRMLIQRIAKEYLLIGLGAEPGPALARLRDSVELFDSQLQELRAFVRGDFELSRLLVRIEKQWREFEAIALAPVDYEGAKALVGPQGDDLLSRDEALLELCDRFAIELEVNSELPLAYYVNLAGRQRMLTQRIAKYYMMISSGFDNDLVRAAMAQAQFEFEAAMQILSTLTPTEGINRDLNQAREQWDWLQSALSFEKRDLLSGKGVFFPLIVEQTSEKVLLILDRLTHRYERLAETG